jgi:hypothetical protein
LWVACHKISSEARTHHQSKAAQGQGLEACCREFIRRKPLSCSPSAPAINWALAGQQNSINNKSEVVSMATPLEATLPSWNIAN